MTQFDEIAIALGGFAENCLQTRRHVVQIGNSPDAIISPAPQVNDLGAQDLLNVAGIAGQPNSPSFGISITVPTESLKAAIAAGLAERQANTTGQELVAATEFYQYCFTPGSCLSGTPTENNPALGARWLVTREDGKQYEFSLLRADTTRSIHHVTFTFVRCQGHSSRTPIY